MLSVAQTLPSRCPPPRSYHWYAHPATGSWWPMLWEPASHAEAAADAPCLTAAEQAGDAAMKEFGVDGLPLIMRCARPPAPACL